MFRKIASTNPSWAPVPLRLALAAIFLGHGAQKVFGVLGGPGLRKFTSFPAPFPFMRPAWLWMGGAALAELIGGALLLLGLFTRLGAFMIFCVMLTVLIGVLWHTGFFLHATPEGFVMGQEFVWAVLGASLALLISGGGLASADRLIGARRR